jgi:hypothetical protein
MKKDMMALTCLVLGISLYGCGNTEKAEVDRAADNSTVQESIDDASTEENVKENAAEQANDEKEITGESYDEIALKVGRNTVSSIVFSFDENGNKVGEYDLAKIEQKLKDADYDLSSFSFVTSYKGILYYSYCDYSSNDYKYKLIAYDPEKGDMSVVTETEYGEYIPSVDIYKGRIYVLMSKEAEGVFSWKLRCFEKDADSLSFTEKETEHADVYDYFSGYNINYVERLCRKDDGPERILDETGFLIGRKDNAYYILYPDKSVKKIESLEFNSGGVKAFDDKRIICPKYEDSYDFKISKYEVIDIDTMQTKDLELPDSAVCLYYRNGKLLYYIKDGKEYGREDITLFSLDVESGKSTELISRKVVAGMHYYSPVVENFEFFEDKAFFTDFVDGEIKVFEVDLGGDDFAPVDLGYVAEKNDLFEYGTVESVSVTSDCPFCGKHIVQAYAEYMVLDGNKVQNAEKINEQLKQHAIACVDNFENYDANDLIYEDSCGHDEDYYYTATEDDNIGSVTVLENRYIAVNMEGYWYGGGAHGMPSRDQYMFDMTTGDEVSFTDLYKGTEEQLKELVATKVKEDYESYTGDDYPPYFMANAQEAYDTAYEYTSIDGFISFTEKGVVYTFYPYDLASYAEGFKEYVLSFEEVFGRSTIAP